jgi:hypothetical protein
MSKVKTLQQMPNVELFCDEIAIEKCCNVSQQAVVFFGREKNIGIKVVLKQYRKVLFGLYREIKIFTEVEAMRVEQVQK